MAFFSGFLPEPLLDFLKPNLPSSLELYKPKPWGLIIFTPISFVLLIFPTAAWSHFLTQVFM